MFGAALEESKEQAPRQLAFSESTINRKPDKDHLQIVDVKVKIDSSSTGKTKTSLNTVRRKEPAVKRLQLGEVKRRDL